MQKQLFESSSSGKMDKNIGSGGEYSLLTLLLILLSYVLSIPESIESASSSLQNRTSWLGN